MKLQKKNEQSFFFLLLLARQPRNLNSETSFRDSIDLKKRNVHVSLNVKIIVKIEQ